MTQVKISAFFEWKPVGQIQLDNDGKLVFPKTSATPGLYRFDIADPNGPATYIGETDQLVRRFQHYRTPGPSQRTNLRLNALMRSALSEDMTISLATVTDEICISLDGDERIADLTRKPERVLLEHAALYEAFASGIIVLNA